MHGSRQWRDSRLLWQGLLVVAPTLLLAGIGVIFLKQTWVWAEREGQDLARQTASELALVRVPEALRNGLSSFDPLSTRRLTRLDLSPDPVLELGAARLPRIALIVDERGDLIYPPPMAPWPVPQLALQARSSSPPGPQSEYASREIAGRAAYHLGRAQEQKDAYAAARREYERILEQFPDVLAASGLPLKIVAGLRLAGPEFLNTSTAGDRAGLLSWLTAEAVYRPTPLSEMILETLARSGAQPHLIHMASRLFQAHEEARKLYRQVAGRLRPSVTDGEQELPPGWVEDTQGSKWLMVPTRDGQNRWLLFMTEPAARKLVTELVAGCHTSPHFRIAVDVAGQALIPPPTDASPIASVSAIRQANRLAGIRATVYLSNPRAFYRQVRVQTACLGALIMLSIGTVGVGLSSAGRALRQQRQLVELKGNFVSSVSHELRAPIASMRLLTEELADLGTGAPPDKLAEYHHLIIRECKRLTHLIENVLEFSRQKSTQPADTFALMEPAALIDETLRLMNPIAAEQDVRLRICPPTNPLPMISASTSGLLQAMVNLLDNAIKYSTPGGTVILGSDFIPAADRDDPRLELWVQDQGNGIAPAEHERIFEPFYRCGSELRRETQGVGLGLTIVRQIIQAHHGQVTVKSAPGQGSRFTISLPASLTQMKP